MTSKDPSLDFGTIGKAVRMAREGGMGDGPYLLLAHPETLPTGWMQGGTYSISEDGLTAEVKVADDLAGVLVPSLRKLKA